MERLEREKGLPFGLFPSATVGGKFKLEREKGFEPSTLTMAR